MSESSESKQAGFFSFFRQICAIPRESGNEREISEYLVAFAKERDFAYHRDDFCNVVIQKPAGKGRENQTPIFLQAHLDMVCEKTPESFHDFTKDGIKIVEKGDIIRAEATSLGADNGVGMAIILQILDEKFDHPPVTAIFTSDEERGLVGVKNFDLSPYNGSILINLDGEREGVLLASCAGGVRCPIRLKTKKEHFTKNENLKKLQIVVRGLKGGHSGLEIDKEHANAILLLARILRCILKTREFFLLDISGGNKENSIPSNAQAVIAFDLTQENAVRELITKKMNEITAEYSATDPDISVDMKPCPVEYQTYISRQSLDTLLSLLLLLPNGSIKRDLIHDAALASSNLGVLRLEDAAILVSSMVRSNIDSVKNNVVEQFDELASLFGAAFELKNNYPAWEYNPHSKIREIAVNTFEAEFGCKPQIQSIHGGLECAYFAQKREGLDMISLGCDLYDVHSVNEHFNFSSAMRTYKFLKRILENIRK